MVAVRVISSLELVVMSPVVIVGVDFTTVVVIVSEALSYLLVPVYTVIIFISSPFIPVVLCSWILFWLTVSALIFLSSVSFKVFTVKLVEDFCILVYFCILTVFGLHVYTSLFLYTYGIWFTCVY